MYVLKHEFIYAEFNEFKNDDKVLENQSSFI